MSWLTRTPREPSAAERGLVVGPCCVACGDAAGPLEVLPLGEHGPQAVCVHATPCLNRAGHVRRYVEVWS